MKNINNIKILSIEDNLHLHKTLENYGVNYILDSKSAYEKISSGWDDFDIVIIRPEMMSTVGKFSKLLGPRGKMPCPKCGTVVNESHLLQAILTTKNIAEERKPNKSPAGKYNEELYQYMYKHGRIRVDKNRYIKEYQPIAKYLRREIMIAILNSESYVSKTNPPSKVK